MIYSATYVSNYGIVTVTTENGSRSSIVDSEPTHRVALRLLETMIQESALPVGG